MFLYPSLPTLITNPSPRRTALTPIGLGQYYIFLFPLLPIRIPNPNPRHTHSLLSAWAGSRHSVAARRPPRAVGKKNAMLTQAMEILGLCHEVVIHCHVSQNLTNRIWTSPRSST